MSARRTATTGRPPVCADILCLDVVIAQVVLSSIRLAGGGARGGTGLAQRRVALAHIGKSFVSYYTRGPSVDLDTTSPLIIIKKQTQEYRTLHAKSIASSKLYVPVRDAKELLTQHNHVFSPPSRRFCRLRRAFPGVFREGNLRSRGVWHRRGTRTTQDGSGFTRLRNRVEVRVGHSRTIGLTIILRRNLIHFSFG